MLLNKLAGIEKAHWELHLKAAQKDLGMTKEIRDFLSSKEQLPDLKHPADIHDWLEYPESRGDGETWQM